MAKSITEHLFPDLQAKQKKISFTSDRNNYLEIPDEVFKMEDLESLNLGKIPVDEAQISRLIVLKNLKELIIQNYTSSEFPIGLMNLKKLTNLSITGSSIQNLPEELDNWQELRYLNLSYNRLLSKVEGVPKNLYYIHIGGTALKNLPPKIYQLKRLYKLVMVDLKLTKFPREIFQIKSLMSLFISNNKLRTIPKEIKKLVKLDELILLNNSFKKLPSSIFELPNLEELNLRANQITSIPNDFINLNSLKKIDLSDNNLTEFPEVLLSMNLTEVELKNASYNKSKKRNQIKNIPTEIIKNNTITQLSLSDNPIENVPIEIVKQGVDAIRNFFQSKLEADNEEFLFEAKMVVVGRGHVGKTVLTKKLIDPIYKLDDSETTFGISILKNPYVANLQVDNSTIQFKLNIWDFGGQEKYDATHQLFITKRSIYLFLTEAREESNYLDFYYWLNTIQLFSDNSPVIIVLSKLDERKKSLPKSLYREKFENIIDFIDVSCAQGYEYTLENLHQAIRIAISQLPQTTLTLSNRWIDIRNELESLSNVKDYISYNEYLQICNKNKLDKKRADFLSQYLNDLGVIIHHKEDFLLKETVFINTDWCVDGMYKVLDSEIVKNGKFTVNDVDDLWDENRFKDKKAELLKLMFQYHLCFELKDNSGFIAPELLPPDRPSSMSWDHSNNLKFQYRYDFMPAGILSRFIVKSHSFIKDSLYWKHGVVLEYEDTTALVEENYINGYIQVSIKGRNKKSLLSAIRMFISEVHKDLDKAGKLLFDEMVPCNCGECTMLNLPYFYKFSVLTKFQDKNRKNAICEFSGDDVQINSLIDDVQNNNTKVDIKTNSDLKDFIEGVLSEVLEREIQMKSSYINFWRDNDCSIPKNEIEIQPYISNTLDNYCKINGIQLSREVKEANGNVDILLSTRNEENKILKLCIEIKKAHHQDIATAIKTQLPEYMRSANTDAGIYLVIWLKNELHTEPVRYKNIQALEDAIVANNPSPTKIGLKIIDCCKPNTPSKIKHL